MLELMKRRRSIRKFKESHMKKQEIEKILKAGLLAPSSRGKRPWEIIAIENKETILKLSESKKHGSQFLKSASFLAVIIGDENKSDAWIEDTSIVASLMLLEAEYLNIGACWVQIRGRYMDDDTVSEDYVKEILKVPDNLRVECIIGFGYKDEMKNEYLDKDLKYEKVHYEKF